MRRIECDHNAGGPPDPRVLERFLEVERAGLANPSSAHAAGRRARAVLEEARAEAADALGVERDDLVFVSWATEANNLVVRGVGAAALPVLLAPFEHPSVLEPARARGAVYWEVDAEGRARVAEPAQAVGLVTLCHAQSELGSLQPCAAAGDLAHALGVPLHVDAAQTLGRVPLAVVLERADSVTFATHKAGGLRGQSVLLLRPRARQGLRPLLLGGGQELGARPGTSSPALAAATARALTLAVREQAQRAQAMRAATDEFRAGVARCACRVLTQEPALPNTVLLLCDVHDGRTILPALDLLGVGAAQGSACASGAARPPLVLTALGLPDDVARRAVRFSFAHDVSVESAREAAQRVHEFLTRGKR